MLTHTQAADAAHRPVQTPPDLLGLHQWEPLHLHAVPLDLRVCVCVDRVHVQAYMFLVTL